MDRSAVPSTVFTIPSACCSIRWARSTTSPTACSLIFLASAIISKTANGSAPAVSAKPPPDDRDERFVVILFHDAPSLAAQMPCVPLLLVFPSDHLIPFGPAAPQAPAAVLFAPFTAQRRWRHIKFLRPLQAALFQAIRFCARCRSLFPNFATALARVKRIAPIRCNRRSRKNSGRSCRCDCLLPGALCIENTVFSLKFLIVLVIVIILFRIFLGFLFVIPVLRPIFRPILRRVVLIQTGSVSGDCGARL